jgi:hypothetical protein
MNPQIVMGAMMHMLGTRVISSAHLPEFRVVQFRFPRSKSKRIRTKWSKREENFKQVPIKNTAYMFGNTIVVDPDTARAINGEFPGLCY